MISKLVYLLVTILLLVSFPTATQAKLPVLIDRDVFFGNPKISGAQISPDGRFISFMKPYKDTRNVWVKGVNEPFEKARLVTAETKRPIGGYFWSRDSKYILFVKDNAGDENFNVYAVDPSDGPAEGSDAPPARNLTEGKKVRAIIQSVPRGEPDVIYVGLNDRDPAWHDMYKVSISSGKKTLILENKDRLQGIIFDNAGKVRLALRSPRNGDTEILSLDPEKPKVIYKCGVFETCAPIRFHKDDARFYLRTNKGDRDLTQLVLFDPVSGAETLVEQDPEGRVDFGSAIFSEVSKELIATTYVDDRARVLWKDRSFERAYKWLKRRLPRMEIGLGSSTLDENKWIVSAGSDIEPGRTYLFDRRKRTLKLQYAIRKDLPRAALARMKPIRYKSSDGLEIPGYLTLPKGVKAENLPLVVFPHGGPWGRDNWGYDTFAQFLANRGYAVLQPNFRASTGYGKKFLDAGNKQWGDLMQDDITWGVKYLVEKGIADKDRVGIMGGSYGGYATLAGVTFTPDTYSAAVAIVAPSNLITLLESVPPYWESFRKIFHMRMGDPNTAEGKEQLIRQSPLTHADKIKTPLMVVQGANDPRVNKRESDQIVIALRDRKYPVEYLVAPDEGHGFRRPINNLAMVAAAERFLAKHLGGRFQDTLSLAVFRRLTQITVDPDDVKLVKKKDMSAAPAVSVAGKWKMMAEAGGQEVPITLQLKQDAGTFSGTIETPFGEGTIENGVISGSNFKGLVKLDFQGQPLELAMEGTVSGGKMKGTMEGAGVPSVDFTAEKLK